MMERRLHPMPSLAPAGRLAKTSSPGTSMMPWQNEPMFIALPDLQVSTEDDAPMSPGPPPGLFPPPPPGLSPPGLFQKKESTVDDCDSTSASSGDHDFSRIRNLIDTFGLPKDMESKGRRVDVAKGGKLIVAS